MRHDARDVNGYHCDQKAVPLDFGVGDWNRDDGYIFSWGYSLLVELLIIIINGPSLIGLAPEDSRPHGNFGLLYCVNQSTKTTF